MKNAQNLIKFIKSSPTPYHAVDTVKSALLRAGYTEVSEADIGSFSDGGRHFTVRGGSSLIAFCGSGEGFSIAASHCDTPAFKLKSDARALAYCKLNVEKYGGAILYSWLDRPLSVAGRVAIDSEDGISIRLVNIDRDIALIPSVAIHQNRSVNDGFSPNPAVDMLPLSGLDGDGVLELIAKELSVKKESILSHDLFIYNRDEGRIVGEKEELILSPRLDDLECVYASLEAFLQSSCGKAVQVLAIFDNEEVGSATKQGAGSTFLSDTLEKISGSRENYIKMLENSFMLSMDNAHAIHPNRPELSDSALAPTLGSGVTLKLNANQSYATDAVSAALVKKLAKTSGARLATYASRADKPCGSTLGSIATTKAPVITADIGLPQLAMHSANETAAISDLSDMIALVSAHFSSAIVKTADGYKII